MMPATVTTDPAALAASLAQWWALAGVDVAVQDMPRDWLSRPRPVAAPVASPAGEYQGMEAAAAPSPPVVPSAQPAEHIASPMPAAPMPDEMEAFLQWLAHDPGQPETAFAQTRILPHMVEGAEMLVITDMPTQDDMAAGQLLSGADARLLSGLLRSLGIDTEKAALASLIMARPAGGIIDDKIVQRATQRLSHFIRLMAPKAIILLGDKTNRAFQQMNGMADAQSTYAVHLDDGMVSATALPAPFVLLKHPERKAAAWAQLRHLAKR